MTDYNSNLVKKKTRQRGLYSGRPNQVAGRLFLASGTALTTADDLLFVPVGELSRIKRVTLEVVGDTSTIAGSIGTFQILDDAGDPVRVDRNGPNSRVASTQYTSPATSAAALRAAGQLDGYTETIITPTDALAGPVNVGIRITTGGTIAADTTIYLGVEFDGEHSTIEVEGDYNPDNSYLL
jgi:hypothetical protein